MGQRKTTIPAISDPRPDNVLEVIKSLKEVVEVAEMRRGDPLDAKVTFRDLINGGLAVQFGNFGKGGGGVTEPLDRTTPGPDSPFLKPPSYEDLVLPGRPLNVHTMAVWDGIQVIWDWPEDVSKNTYWKRAVIWASGTPDFAYAQLIGATATNFFTHEGIGLSAPDIPGVTTQPGVRYYWVAWEGIFNEATGEADRSEPNPYFHQPGIRGQTALDPTYVLELMSGQIRESHIYGTLNDRINLIDYDDDGNYIGSESIQGRLLSAMTVAEDNVKLAIAQTSYTSHEDGVAKGEYALRVDLDGYIVGFGISAMKNIAGGTSDNSTSTFMIQAEQFAVVWPEMNDEGERMIPFIVSKVGGVNTVGINGQLIVDGTITAQSIQAGSIGTAQLNATEVYAEFLTANRIIGATLSTSVYPNMRLELNGEGTSKEQYPLWFGRETTGSDQTSVFYITNQGTMKMAGELFVTGAGKFFLGNYSLDVNGDIDVTKDEWRLELGGPADDFVLWAGKGLKSKGNEDYAFWIDRFGKAKFKGTLEAKYVSGEISRTTLINEYLVRTPSTRVNTSNISSIPETAWLEIGRWECPYPPFASGHVPYCSVAFDMYGNNQTAGAARLQWTNKVDPVDADWITLNKSAYDIANYGETKCMIASAQRQTIKSLFRLQIASFNNQLPTSGSRQGIVMGIR